MLNLTQQNLQYEFAAPLTYRKYSWGEEIVIRVALSPLFNHSYTMSKLNLCYLDRVIKNAYTLKMSNGKEFSELLSNTWE